MYVKALNIKRLLQEPKFNLANELNCRHYCIPGERPRAFIHITLQIFMFTYLCDVLFTLPPLLLADPLMGKFGSVFAF